MGKERVHIFVSGKVQGVFYRKYTEKKAKELGLLGWCKNLSDGRVEIVAEGEREKLDKLAEWAKTGLNVPHAQYLGDRAI